MMWLSGMSCVWGFTKANEDVPGEIGRATRNAAREVRDWGENAAREVRDWGEQVDWEQVGDNLEDLSEDAMNGLKNQLCGADDAMTRRMMRRNIRRMNSK